MWCLRTSLQLNANVNGPCNSPVTNIFARIISATVKQSCTRDDTKHNMVYNFYNYFIQKLYNSLDYIEITSQKQYSALRIDYYACDFGNMATVDRALSKTQIDNANYLTAILSV